MKGICKQIVSARSHTALLNTEGQIFVCGSLLFGRLGINTKTAKVNNYREFKLLTDKNLSTQKIVKLACGDFHTLALS
jgi:alpha-tubulin suppressor-like RCC1 family protein